MPLATIVLLFGLALTPELPVAKAPVDAYPAPLVAEDVLVTAAPTIAASVTPQEPRQDPPQQPPQEQKPDKAEEKKPETPPHTGIHALFDGLKEDIHHLPSRPNLYLALIGGGLAAAVHPADQHFNVRLRSHYTVVNRAFAPAKYFGNTPEQLALSIGTYVFGRVTHKPKVAHFGMDLLRAQALTEILVLPIKFATRRERPDGSNHQSFPSGHAAVTFAAATVIERHLGWKNTVLGYAIASYVAVSRLHDNRHYLSDVVFGAAVGAIAGRTVTEHGRETWAFTPATVPGGVALFVTRLDRRAQ